MARQHDRSCDCTSSALDLFAIPPTQTAIDHGYWTDTHPVATLTDRSPIEFNIAGDGENYIDLANTFLYLKASIRNPDGSTLAADDVPGPVNNWMHSLFEEVTITVGDTVVSHSSHAYPYRAYLETLLSHGSDAKKSQQTCSLWYKDTAGQMNHRSSKEGENNVGLVKRGSFTALGRPVEMVGRLHTDILSQDKFLLNNVPVKVKLSRSKDDFSLMAPATKRYKVAIEAAVLYYRRVKVMDSVMAAHEKVLTSTPATYPITRVQCKYFSIPQGMTTVNHENLFRGQMPTRVVVGLVDTGAFNGNWGKNPFNFEHKNLSKIALYIADMKTPIKELTPDHPHQNIMSYMSLFTGLGKWLNDEGCGVERSEYAQGYCLYAWDLTADLSDPGNHFQLLKSTNLRLELLFKDPLNAPTTAIVYSEFQNMIMIDKDRNVTNNYSA